MEIKVQDIYAAYRKYKSYVYYDNTAFMQKLRIAEFENKLLNDDSEFKIRFEEIANKIKHVLDGDDENILDEWMSCINMVVLPKSAKPLNGADTTITYLTNVLASEGGVVTDYNILIDAPVEIHLISTLWVMFVGCELDKQLSKDNYAYRLYRNWRNDEEHSYKDGLLLFEPYYNGYQDWRDNAISKVEQLLDNGDDATIVGLDIKKYYYSVRLNVEKLEVDHSDYLAQRLCRLLQKIHEYFVKIISPYLQTKISPSDMENGRLPLPVGLLSSGVLANCYLHNFDTVVNQKISPAYYGRYVDDIIIVLRNREIDNIKPDNDIRNFFNKVFVESGLFEESCNDNCVYNIIPEYVDSKLEIHQGKVVLMHFKHGESKAAIKIFRENINKNRSEFRFLPFEESIDHEFDDDAFRLEYEGSVNKIRSLKNVSEYRFGASKFLAHKLFLSTFPIDKSEDDNRVRNESSQQILNYFKGWNNIDLWMLWEKVTTYFFINNEFENIEKFRRNSFNAIDALVYRDDKGHETNEIKDFLKSSLRRILDISISMPLALNLGRVLLLKHYSDSIEGIAMMLRKAFMYRHNVLPIPGIGFTDYGLSDSNLLSEDLSEIIGLQLNISEAEQRSPFFIHFHVIEMLVLYRMMFNPDYNHKDLIDESKRAFISVNYNWRKLFLPEGGQKSATLEDFPYVKAKKIEKNGINCYGVDVIDFQTEESTAVSPNKTVGIANWRMDSSDVESSAKGKNILSRQKRKQLFDVINDAIENKSDVIVLPELAIPIEWLPLLIAQSKKSNIAIICGIDYVVLDKMVYNFVATILPLMTQYYTTAMAVLRLKNDYSPGERRLIEGLYKSVPEVKNKQYDLFHWRQSYFSVYNCFELCNISDRALFHSKVDFITAIEFNSDINYFSNIAESWSRDLHCFIIQVNVSQYGDSRIVQPTSRERVDLINVKGGRNTTLLVDQLDIDSIRNFQMHSYTWQTVEGKGIFKPTPPRYDYEYTNKRCQNQSSFEVINDI